MKLKILEYYQIQVSNGEKNADLNWDRLQKLCPRAKRIDGVNGRAQAYKACAELSQTDWFINVFAKCWVHDDFDFDWQPDYMQNDKHYIFDAYNPVTELTYGHMGIIAYNKQLVLDCDEWGLDFTLSMPHSSVPVVGSTADYATTPYETWRTAFRECIKLDQQKDIESEFRLKQWPKFQDVIGASVDLLFCNEEEAKAYTGASSLLEAREALKKDAKRFVITMGKNGAMIFDGDTFIDIEPFPVKAVDTNGAGDMFAGSFLYGITNGLGYAASGKLATKAASKVVGQYGPRLSWQQMHELLK